MDMRPDFDPRDYLTTPPLDVPGIIALSRQLLALAPADVPKPAETCKRQLARAVKDLEAGYQASQTQDPAVRRKPIDAAADTAWGCIKTRLEPYLWIDPARHPPAHAAQRIYRKLFPSGLSFTQLEFGAQWAEASWRIQVLADEGLEPELRRLCGDFFVDELLHWHREYGQMVGVHGPSARAALDGKPAPNLLALRKATTGAIIAWQAQLVALHLAGHPTARAALQPTDAYRDKLDASAPAAGPPQPGADPTPPASPRVPPVPPSPAEPARPTSPPH